MMRHSVQKRVDERISLPWNCAFPSVLIEESRETGDRIIFESGELFDEASAESNAWGCGRDSNSVLQEPFAHRPFVEPHIKTFIRLQKAEHGMTSRIANFDAIK